MTKRLQVLLDDDEMAGVRRAARRQGQSVAQWVRAAIRDARAADGRRSAADKLRALHEATRHDLPTGSIDEMLAEIERGYTRPR